ncbi:MAG: PqiC family protein [Candidatus Binatus sp.]
MTPLSDGAASGASTASTAQPLTIGIGPIEFPDYLRRLEVVTRTSPNQLDLSSEKRWGEPLDKNFTRVLGENLAELLNTDQIEKYPWPRKTQVDYQIAIDVQRFETSSDGQSKLVARWNIKDGATGKDLYSSQINTSAPVGPGETGASAALSSDLATLSRDIAHQVDELRRHQASTGTTDNFSTSLHLRQRR